MSNENAIKRCCCCGVSEKELRKKGKFCPHCYDIFPELKEFFPEKFKHHNDNLNFLIEKFRIEDEIEKLIKEEKFEEVKELKKKLRHLKRDNM